MLDGWDGVIVVCVARKIMASFEHAESTAVWDHSGGTVELYTTKRTTWLRAISRNPNFIPGSAKDLQPGYVITYPITECRTPEAVVRPCPDPTGSTLDAFLTDAERAQRSKAADNLGDKRGKRPQDRAKQDQ